jgi:hypothetical protein
VVAFVVIS